MKESDELLQSISDLSRQEPRDVDELTRLRSQAITFLRRAGRYDESYRVGEEGLAEVEDANRPDLKSTLLRMLALAHWTRCDFQGAIEINRQALGICEALGDVTGAAYARRQMGVCYHNLSDYPTALEHLEQARKEFQALENRLEDASTAYWCGVCHSSTFDSEQALEELLFALEVFKEFEHTQGIGDAYNSLGVLFFSMKLPARAQEFFELALDIRRGLGEPRGIADVLNNLGMIHRVKGELEVALDYYHQALAVHERMESWQKAANVISNIGSVLEQQGQYEKARDFNLRALKLRRDLNHPEGILSSTANLASTYLRLNQPDEAWEVIKEVVEKLDTLPDSHRHRYYALLADYYEAIGDFSNSLQAHKRANYLNQLLYDEVRITKLNDSVNRFISSEKTREAEALREKNVELEQSYTQLKKAHEEIIELEKRNAALAMAITANHELNQPLMVAFGNLELLAEDIRVMPINENTLKRLQRTRDALERISTILERFRNDNHPSETEYVGDTRMWKYDSVKE
jgi:tetratricopeptide (TPR) repeat protein